MLRQTKWKWCLLGQPNARSLSPICHSSAQMTHSTSCSCSLSVSVNSNSRIPNGFISNLFKFWNRSENEVVKNLLLKIKRHLETTGSKQTQPNWYGGFVVSAKNLLYTIEIKQLITLILRIKSVSTVILMLCRYRRVRKRFLRSVRNICRFCVVFFNLWSLE